MRSWLCERRSLSQEPLQPQVEPFPPDQEWLFGWHYPPSRGIIGPVAP